VALAAQDRVKEAGRRWPVQPTASTPFAVLLAAAILMIGYLLMPEVADLMPPPLSGAH
jgi:hypothetical protein